VTDAAAIFASEESRRKLKDLIEKTVLAGSASDHEREFTDMQREEMMAIAAAMPNGDNSSCADGRARHGVATPPSPSLAAPVGATPPEKPQPQRIDPNLTPANPPDARNEPWRPYSHLYIR
jgi:hypothetical protein